MHLGRLSGLICSSRQVISSADGQSHPWEGRSVGLQFQMVAFPDPIPIQPSLGRSTETMQSLMDKRLTGKKATTEILVGLEVGRPDFSFQFGNGTQSFSSVRVGSYC